MSKNENGIDLPVKVGKLLVTSSTKRWPRETWDLTQHQESLEVYSHFTYLDQGQSRVLVCRCTTPEAARQIVFALNNRMTGRQRIMHFFKTLFRRV